MFSLSSSVAACLLVILLLTDAIMGKIREAGFKISLSKETTLTREMAEQLYSEHKGKEFFDDLTGLMSKYV